MTTVAIRGDLPAVFKPSRLYAKDTMMKHGTPHTISYMVAYHMYSVPGSLQVVSQPSGSGPHPYDATFLEHAYTEYRTVQFMTEFPSRCALQYSTYM